jgi:hypothetical protein
VFRKSAPSPTATKPCRLTSLGDVLEPRSSGQPATPARQPKRCPAASPFLHRSERVCRPPASCPAYWAASQPWRNVRNAGRLSDEQGRAHFIHFDQNVGGEGQNDEAYLTETKVAIALARSVQHVSTYKVKLKPDFVSLSYLL